MVQVTRCWPGPSQISAAARFGYHAPMKSCFACRGTKFKRKKVEVVTRIGEHEVTHTPEEDVCLACGRWSIHAVDADVFALTSATRVLREHTLTGAMIKDVRHVVGISRAELAEHLGVPEDTVAGWEQGAQFERWLSLALVGLVYNAFQRDIGFPARKVPA